VVVYAGVLGRRGRDFSAALIDLESFSFCYEKNLMGRFLELRWGPLLAVALQSADPRESGLKLLPFTLTISQKRSLWLHREHIIEHLIGG